MDEPLWQVFILGRGEPLPEGAFRPSWLPPGLFLDPLPGLERRQEVAELFNELDPIGPYVIDAADPRQGHPDGGDVIESGWVLLQARWSEPTPVLLAAGSTGAPSEIGIAECWRPCGRSTRRTRTRWAVGRFPMARGLTQGNKHLAAHKARLAPQNRLQKERT